MTTASAIITSIDDDIEQQLGPGTHAQLRAILEDLTEITTRTAPLADGSPRPQRSRRST